MTQPLVFTASCVALLYICFCLNPISSENLIFGRKDSIGLFLFFLLFLFIPFSVQSRNRNVGGSNVCKEVQDRLNLFNAWVSLIRPLFVSLAETTCQLLDTKLAQGLFLATNGEYTQLLGKC